MVVVNNSESSGVCSGLFGYVKNGEIKNVGVEKSIVVSSSFSSYACSGGIAGGNEENSTISNCYNTGKVYASGETTSLGGVCGDNYNGTIEGCYYDTDLLGKEINAIGYNEDSTTTTNATGLTTAKMQGKEAKTNMIGFADATYNDISTWTFEDGKYPLLSVFKTSRGDEVVNDGVTNYVVKGGPTSAEIDKYGMIWLKEESGKKSAWYGIDNTNKIFRLGSRFWVRWLNEEEDADDWATYYGQLDEKHKAAVDSGRLRIFLVGVTDPEGNKYKDLDPTLPLYIQIKDDNVDGEAGIEKKYKRCSLTKGLMKL